MAQNQTFTAVLHQEGKWWVADCPEAGTVSQGETAHQAVANLKEATELYLEEFPGEQHRNIELDPIVLECPKCGVIGVSSHLQVEERHGNGIWKLVNALFACGACGETALASKFENDGSGVMRVRTWTCVTCLTKNSALKYSCAKCRCPQSSSR